jgi:hypothetical protein
MEHSALSAVAMWALRELGQLNGSALALALA